MVRRYLVSTDLSHFSDAAIEYASILAKKDDAELLIVHVQEETDVYSGESYYGAPKPSPSALSSLLHKIVPTRDGVSFRHLVLQGDPAASIAECVQAEEVSLIVLATHGRRGLSRLLMGSTAERIIRTAPCPVLVLKSPPKEAFSGSAAPGSESRMASSVTTGV